MYASIMELEYDLSFNPTRLVLLIFGHAEKKIKGVTLSMCGRNVKSASNEKHHSRFLSSTGNLIDIKTVIRDIKIRANLITSNLQQLQQR